MLRQVPRAFAIKTLFNFLHITGDLIMKLLIRFIGALFITLTLLTAAGCGSTQTREGSGEYVDDSVITTKVKAQLLNEPGLSSAQINVETFKGKVQLSGFVKSQADIDRAIQITRQVVGVKSVKNDMRLR
jgi:hypothetical protein